MGKDRAQRWIAICDAGAGVGAGAVLASRGRRTSRISRVAPPASAATHRPSADVPRMVLLHGRLEDTERAHEILADEAARVQDLEPTTA